MGTETELKLDVTPAHARKFSRSRWLRKIAGIPPVRQRMVSVYYDTKDLELRKLGVMLRVRRIGKRRIQTVKADSQGGGGALSRSEWEKEIFSDRPDCAEATRAKIGGLNFKKLRYKLKPIFETDIVRLSIPVRYHGGELEIAIDLGKVKVGRKTVPIHEIEIELKSGDRQALVALGRRVAKLVAARYGSKSKAQRGYELREGGDKTAAFATEFALSQNLAVAESFQAIGMTCVRHFAGNEGAVAAGDAVGVHQMRVGLRRLRAAISFYKEILDGPETERVKKSLKWLTEELGPARDLDVLVDETIMPMENANPRVNALHMLAKDIKRKRDDGFARAVAAVKSDMYRRTVLATVLWLAGGHWSRAGGTQIAARRQQSARRFAAHEMSGRRKNIIKKLRDLETLTPLHRHKLRIAIKKLRYASDFFASFFPDHSSKRRRKQFEKILENLQSELGKLNDIRVHKKLAASYIKPPPQERMKVPKAFAMGMIAGQDGDRIKSLIKAAQKTGKGLSQCKCFWR